MDWQWALELGRYLGRIERLEDRVDRIERAQGETRTLVRRACLLLVLWGAGILLTLSSERGADLVALVIKGLLSRL